MAGSMSFKDGDLVGDAILPERFSKRDFNERDIQDLAEQGKRQQFNRNFDFLSMLGFATTMMCTWEAVYFSNATAMMNGGSVTLIYGFLLCWVGTLATAASLAELSSMAPISGGQYHWVAMLAPERSKIFLSWITGWLATVGWNANTSAGIFFSGTVIQGLMVLNYPDYAPQNWHGTLLMYAALCVVFLVNTVAARFLPKIEGIILILHTLGFFAVLIPLTYFSDKNSAAWVFTEFVNEAGWSSDGLAFFVGLISSNLPFIGYDGPCHMAEECADATTVVPWTIICTVLLNGALGFAVSVTLAFCATDVQQSLASPTGYDFIDIFYSATLSHAGTSLMTAILIALVTAASFGFLASTSRQTWAFSRDRGLPFSDWLVYVSPRRALPLRAIVVCAVITALICLINVGSTAAFNAIVSITIGGLFTSYLIPVTLVAWRRASGHPIRWGPWRLGQLGLPVNVVSICFLLMSISFSFFPPGVPVTLQNMNWSCAVFGGLVIVGLVYWFTIGHKVYHGPIVEHDGTATELEERGR